MDRNLVFGILGIVLVIIVIIFSSSKKSDSDKQSTTTSLPVKRCPLNYELRDGFYGKMCETTKDCEIPEERECNSRGKCQYYGVENPISNCISKNDCYSSGVIRECVNNRCISSLFQKKCNVPEDCLDGLPGESETQWSCQNGYCYGPEWIPKPFRAGTVSCDIDKISNGNYKVSKCDKKDLGKMCKMIDIDDNPINGICTNIINTDTDKSYYCVPEYLCVPDESTNPVEKTGRCKPFMDVVKNVPVLKWANTS